MRGLPQGWAEFSLGRVISLNYGKSLPASARDGGKFAVFGSNGIVGHHSQAITAAPAIIVGRKGSFGEVHFSNAPCFPIDTTYYADSFETLDVRFAFHLLRHLPLTEMNRASAVPGLNRDDAYGLRIDLPPLAEQRRIVAKVDVLTAHTARVRKELDRIPALITRYKQRLLALAADGAMTSKWRDENGVGEWLPTTVGDTAEATFDGPFGSNLKSADYVANGVRVVRLENIGSLRFIREKEAYVAKPKFKSLLRHELKPDDVLFSSFIAEEIRVCLLPGDLETIAINKADCFCVRVNRRLCLPKFLAFRLASPTCYEVLKEAVHGATRPRISLTQLKRLEIELPSLKEQAEIVRRIESAFGWLDRMAADHAVAARLIAKLDAAILNKAFRGDLVPQDPNDEPARVLLERISAERAAAPKAKKIRVVSAGKIDLTLTATATARGTVKKARSNRMSKSRRDDDVMGQPYLATLLRDGRRSDVQTLFRAADLPVADFYKQLAWEIGAGHIDDDTRTLKAAA